MFTKSKINEPIETPKEATKPVTATTPTSSIAKAASKPVSLAQPAASSSRAKPITATTQTGGPSIISPDLKVIGNLETEGDLQIEGTVEGDIRAHLLTIGEKATIRGEIVAEDVVVNGHVFGRIRGQKVRLASTGQVEGDILHNTIAIEAGAHFEGSVHRSDDPINDASAKPAPANQAKAS
jgi:cytoskeletal protein CcmA (bactofilin family)